MLRNSYLGGRRKGRKSPSYVIIRSTGGRAINLKRML